jgi:hypothetical protein
MNTTISKIFGMGIGAAALVATALPAAAASFTQPGATMGAAAGANPPPGLYFINAANYGIGGVSPTEAVGVEVPIFVWSTGWNFLGASYAASVAFPFVEVGIHNVTYLRSPFNPAITPIDLSWNLGNGLFVSFAETIYIPIAADVNGTNSPAGVVSGAAFEQRVAISYIGNDWIASVNGIFGIVTNDGNGTRGADYVNVDWTLAHTFGKWTFGAVGYGAWDVQGGLGTGTNGAGFPAFENTALGRAVDVGAGGMLGYNFGPVDLTIKATHEFITHGDAAYGKEDTRIWTTIVIPIWNPAPPAPRPLIAKY